MQHKDYFLSDRTDKNFTNYYWFKDGFTNEEVNRIETLVNPDALKDGVVFSEKDDKDTLHKIRKSKITWIESNNNSTWLYDKFINLTDIANKKMWDFTLVGMTEQIQYSHYDSNKSHYGYHLDLGNGHASRRKISMVVQLSDPDEYEGGDLVFYIKNTETFVPKKKGAVVLFPSFFLHKVTPVTKGLRKSLVAWVSGPMFT